jgi:regulatory protein
VEAGSSEAGSSEAGTSEALESALAALRYRDLSEHELDEKLAARGFREDDRADAVATLRRTGLLDERRFAAGLATALAARGAGDAFIRDALRRAGVVHELADETIEALEPESARARGIAERRGRGPRTARYLAGKGFSADTIVEVVGGDSLDLP